ncbi:hypothetical protein [Haloarchaeobius sp. DFWS5]|uniref:hypothetical protein n=1 Tax=Haloarchaeobius sp. DFWS5 TaxID=3446114 RepID=UPI003EBF1451
MSDSDGFGDDGTSSMHEIESDRTEIDSSNSSLEAVYGIENKNSANSSRLNLKSVPSMVVKILFVLLLLYFILYPFVAGFLDLFGIHV